MMPLTNGGLERGCRRCGMERSEWSASGGYNREGLLFCCEGCAERTGCTCGPEDQPRLQSGGYAGL